MRLVCPVCGGLASAEAWANDPACRRTVDLLSKLPGIVASRALPYLGLFRQGPRGLSWQRAEKLAGELAALVGEATLSWDGGEARPITPDVWARALDAVLQRRPEALQNHNYLRHAAWAMAGEREKGRPTPGAPAAADGRAGPATPGSEDGGRYRKGRPPGFYEPTDAEREQNKRRIREFNEQRKRGDAARLGALVTQVGEKMRLPE